MTLTCHRSAQYSALGRRNPRTVLSAFVALAVGSLLAVPGTAMAGQSNADHTIKIGITDALSGAGAFYGQPQLGAWRVVANQFNSESGVPINGSKYKIKLYALDDQWTPTDVKNVVDKEVLSDHVQVVVTSGSPQDPVVVPVTEPHHVILEDRTATVNLVKSPNEYVWNSWSAAYVDSKPFFQEMLKLHPTIKSVYGVGIDFQYDINNLKWDQTTATSMGLDWMGQVLYPTSTVSFTSVLQPVVAANPSMVILGSESSDAPAIVKTLRQLGYKGIIAGDVASTDLQYDISGGGAAMKGYYQVEAFTWPQTSQLKKFIKQYTSLGYKWNALAADQWIANELMIKAFETAGTTTTNKVMNAVTKVSTQDFLVPGAPEIKLGGQKTYGKLRELAFPLALNQDVNGHPKTIALLHVTIP